MKKILDIKPVYILIISSIIMIYFQLYWHYWFVKLMRGYVVNSLLPIMLLFSVFLMRELVSQDMVRIKKRKIFYLLVPLCCYIFFASDSIIINEIGFNAIKRYLIYIYSPVIIFLSILGLNIYKRNTNIKTTLYILFICSVLFSIYVTITYSVNPLSVSEMPVLETNRGDVMADTGASYGLGDLSMSYRYTIPGISSTTYGPLLVPLIFIGLYFRKHAVGRSKYYYTFLILFLIFCIFMTVSRGPLIALMAGMVYIAFWRWFKFKEVIFTILIIIISFLTFAKLSFLRLAITFASFIPLDVLYLGNYLPDIIEDPRLMSIDETLSYIYQHPFWGMGMSNLIDIQDVSFGKEHNNYLSIGASFGLLTLICYILFIIVLFILAHKMLKKTSKDPLNRDIGIVLCAGLLSFIVYLNFAPAEFHFIWLWFGLVAAWARNCENGLSPKTTLNQIVFQ